MTFMNTVKMSGYVFPDFTLTWNLASGMTVADIGKTVAVSANSTVGIAADDAHIVGVLTTFEDRASQGQGLVGAVEHRFARTFPAAPSHGIVAGDYLVANGTGGVKKAGSGVFTSVRAAAVAGNVITAVSV